MLILIFTEIQVLFALVWTCFVCSLGPYFVQVLPIQVTSIKEQEAYEQRSGFTEVLRRPRFDVFSLKAHYSWIDIKEKENVFRQT